MFPTLIVSALVFLQAPVPPVLEGAKLQQVPGPIPPKYADPAGGFPTRQDTDIQFQMRRRARVGTVKAVAVPSLPVVIEDKIDQISGWKAYRVEAPGGATVKARLHGTHEAWFRVHTVNRWGDLEKGMLQNRIPTGNPEASFINPKAETTTLYFLVDTTELGAETESFRLEFTVK
jgi:hypothetical protein